MQKPAKLTVIRQRCVLVLEEKTLDSFFPILGKLSSGLLFALYFVNQIVPA